MLSEFLINCHWQAAHTITDIRRTRIRSVYFRPFSRMLSYLFRLFLVLVLLLTTLPAHPVSADNETTITISADEMNRLAIKTYIISKLQSLPENRQYEMLIQMKYTMITLTRDPHADPSLILTSVNRAMIDYNEQMQGVNSKTKRMRWGVDLPFALIKDLANRATRGSFSATADLLIENIRDPFDKAISAIERTEMQHEQLATRQKLSPREVQTRLVGNFVDRLLYSNIQGGHIVFDGLLQDEEFNIRHDDTVDTLRQKDPNFAENEVFKQILTNGGTLTIDQVKALMKAEYGKTNALVQQQLALLDTIAQQQTDIKKWIENQEARAKAEEDARILAEQHRVKLAAAQASFYLLSTLAGQIDPKLAHEIEVVGNSSLQIADAYSNYSQAVAAFGEGAAAGKFFGSIIATGNVMGAAMSIFSLFSKNGSNPEAMTAVQLAAIRQQIAQLREEMHERFDRVDQQLNAIHDKLDYYFTRTDLRLGKIQDDLDVIQQDLYDLQSRLTRLEQRLTAYLQDGFRQELILTVNGKLNYADTYNDDMSYAEYKTAENLFYTWATDTSRRSNEAGPPSGSRSTRPEDIFDELNGDMDKNLNYLSDVLPTLGLPRLPSGSQPLPNPRTWALSARAYTQLALEWPQHDRQVTPARLEQIYRTGKELEAALKSLTVRETPNGPQTNYALYDRLVENYNSEYDPLDQAIQAIERQVESQYKADRRLNPGIDLWGGVDQAFPQQSDYPYPYPTKLLHCRAGNHGAWAFWAPRNAIWYTHRVFVLAWHLGLGSIDECYMDHYWTDATTQWQRLPDGSLNCGRFGLCSYTLRANVWVGIQNRYNSAWGNIVVHQRFLNSGVTGTSTSRRK